MGSPKSGIDWLFGILVLVLVATSILPAVFSALTTMGADTTNFTTAQRALIAIIGTILLVVFVVRIYKGHT